MNLFIRRTLLVLLGVIVCLASSAQASERPKLSLALDGVAAMDITKDDGYALHESLKNGMGGYALLDYRIFRFLTVGAGFGVIRFSGDAGERYNTMLDLAGRIILAPGKRVEPYLLGGFGKNILMDQLEDPWLGNYHAQAGLGMRYAFSPRLDLDLAAVYDAWSPKDARMDVVDVRLGMAFNIGPKGERREERVAVTPKSTPVPTPDDIFDPGPAPAAPPVVEEAPVEVVSIPTPEPVVTPSAPILTYYEVRKGDTLWGISASDKGYNDPFQWPLIFKANRDQIQDPDLIYPDQNLKVRHDHSDAERQAARDKASQTPKYVPHTKPRENLPVDYLDY
jgi:LysM repeat protein